MDQVKTKPRFFRAQRIGAPFHALANEGPTMVQSRCGLNFLRSEIAGEPKHNPPQANNMCSRCVIAIGTKENSDA